MAVRFGFGDNWLRFVSDLKENQVVEAQELLQKLLGLTDRRGLLSSTSGLVVGFFRSSPAGLALTFTHLISTLIQSRRRNLCGTHIIG